MRTLHISQEAYEQLLRTLLDAQHFFLAFDQTKVTQEGTTYTFEARGFTKALKQALKTVGWRDGDPMPPGLPFERLSPHPLGPSHASGVTLAKHGLPVPQLPRPALGVRGASGRCLE